MINESFLSLNYSPLHEIALESFDKKWYNKTDLMFSIVLYSEKR